MLTIDFRCDNNDIIFVTILAQEEASPRLKARRPECLSFLNSNYRVTQSPSPLMRHRASTVALHQILFFAIGLASPQAFQILTSSSVTVSLHICFGLPPFLLLRGFHLIASPSSRYDQYISTSFVLLMLLYLLVLLFPAVLHSSHSARRHHISGRVLLTNVCTLLSRAMVSHQVHDT